MPDITLLKRDIRFRSKHRQIDTWRLKSNVPGAYQASHRMMLLQACYIPSLTFNKQFHLRKTVSQVIQPSLIDSP